MLSTTSSDAFDVGQGYHGYGKYRSGGSLPTNYRYTGQELDICNAQWFEYSGVSGFADTAADAVAWVGCLALSCHVDRERNVVTGPTEQEAFEQSANSVMSAGLNPIGMVAGPGLSAGGGALNRATQAIVKKADDFVARYGLQGTYQTAAAAAKNKVPLLPGLFKYNDKMLKIPGYQRHHLWPEALGGPSEGWAIYVQVNPTNFHTARGGLQPWVDDQLMQRTGLGRDAMRQWARNNTQELLSMLREIYHEIGIEFPY